MSEKPRRLWMWCSVVLLLVFWGRVLVNLHAQSPTVDEPVHLARGLAYWHTGDLRLQYGHPPLAHALIGALPMLEPGIPSPAQVPGWADASRLDVTHRMLWKTPNRPTVRLVFLGRWPVLALGLLLGALSYRWAADLFGPRAGLLALFLYTFDPNILAHAGLATTDLPVTCMIFAAGYAFFRWLRRPSRDHLLVAGLTLGLAWGAKLSSLVLMPVLGLALLWRAWRDRRRLIDLLIGFAGILGLSALILWAIYRFETGTAAGLWVPMPTHWDNLRRLWLHQSTGHSAYFLGQLSQEGWWYYFPVLFLIKTPLALLLLLAASLAMVRQAPEASPLAMVFFFIALYFAAAIVSDINIGYRHILPVVPFVIVITSALWREGLSLSRGIVIISTGLILWLAASSLSIHPHYLTYFNEIVGGADQGYRYAVDSNFDWGQDLRRLGRYVKNNEDEIEELKLSYFGADRPSRYLDDFEVLPTTPFEMEEPGFHPFNPDPGTYAISASHLQGLNLLDADVFDWFRRREPMAKVGSIFIYQVEPDQPPPTWAALCHAPAPPLSQEKLTIGLGRDNLRVVHFDCRSSWVYPTGSGSGWYLIPAYSEGSTLTDRFLRDEMIVFQGRSAKSRPALTVYRWEAADEPSDQMTSLTDQAKAGDFGDVLTFLGSEREVEDDPETSAVEVTLVTYWRVISQSDEPLSVMAHLTGEDGEVLDVADGLGVPVKNWMPGDVLAQVHAFTFPQDAPPGPYTPRIGLYTAGAMEHIPLADGSGDVLSLAPLHTTASQN